MTITYPRSLPSFLTSGEVDLRLNKGTTGALMRGGGVQTVQHAQPFWDLAWNTPPLTKAQKAELTAWWESLRGGLKTFLAYDPSTGYPVAYASEAAVLALTRYGGGSFDGSFALTTVSANELRAANSALSNAQMLLLMERGMGIDLTDDSYVVATTVPVSARPPAGLQLTAGDMISVSQAGRYSLHRVVETVAADASGNFGASNPIAIEPAITTTLFTGGTAVANVVKPLAEFVPDESRFEAVQTLTASPAVIAGFSKVIY